MHVGSESHGKMAVTAMAAHLFSTVLLYVITTSLAPMEESLALRLLGGFWSHLESWAPGPSHFRPARLGHEQAMSPHLVRSIRIRQQHPVRFMSSLLRLKSLTPGKRS